jgi:16S rRNA (guanine527-N7)-methyltransferase
MFSENAIEKLLTGLTSLGVNYTQAQVDQLIQYWSLVEETNKFMNLTRIVGDQAITHHILDAASIIPFIDSNLQSNLSLKIIDIGTGCGVPGVIFKILKPSYEVVLLDSVLKKVKFLNNTIEQMNLGKSIVAVHSRAEDLVKDKSYNKQFDIVVSRAVSALDNIINYSVGFAKNSGYIICMKGPRVGEELDSLRAKDSKLASKIQIHKVKVPFIEDQRFLAVYKAN